MFFLLHSCTFEVKVFFFKLLLPYCTSFIQKSHGSFSGTDREVLQTVPLKLTQTESIHVKFTFGKDQQKLILTQELKLVGQSKIHSDPNSYLLQHTITINYFTFHQFQSLYCDFQNSKRWNTEKITTIPYTLQCIIELNEFNYAIKLYCIDVESGSVKCSPKMLISLFSINIK